MKNWLLGILIFAAATAHPFSPTSAAQDAIFPGLIGEPLLEMLDDAYTPTSWQTYDVARNTLFASIDRDGDSLPLRLHRLQHPSRHRV
jgi:hypothetical protein